MKLAKLDNQAVRSNQKTKKVKGISDQELRDVTGGHAHYHYPDSEIASF